MMQLVENQLMQYWPGGEALTDARRQQVLAAARQVLPGLAQVKALRCYFSCGALTGEQRQRLSRVIALSGAPLPAAEDGWLVLPRAGTVSAWCSRAVEICRRVDVPVQRLERGMLWQFYAAEGNLLRLSSEQLSALNTLLYDRMLESLLPFSQWQAHLLHLPGSSALSRVEVGQFDQLNRLLALGLSSAELDYLGTAFASMNRSATDVELYMFAQVNSEHCRHKIFNARWRGDYALLADSLFAMIRSTTRADNPLVLSAYHDNAAVLCGGGERLLVPGPDDRVYREQRADLGLVLKVETHNHPTGVSPWPGAATGVGGELRDGAATGRGSKQLFGIAGFAVSHLDIPGFGQAWEHDRPRLRGWASPLKIMTEAPVGAATYANEFGRPQLAGFFRTFCQWGWRPLPQQQQGESEVASSMLYGYHKPIMLAGGVGQIDVQQVEKKPLRPGDLLICLGGPALRIGLGGGSASSQQAGQLASELDFSSVQRANAEIERCCQEVIDRCWQRQADNPIRSIHDLGAGGLATAVPEMLHDNGVGGTVDLALLQAGEEGMSALELWCNEAQERYLIALAPQSLALFEQLCQRESCPVAVIGQVNSSESLEVWDRRSPEEPVKVVDLPLGLLFDQPRLLECRLQRHHCPGRPWLLQAPLEEALERVLALPAVASKSFLINIADRSVGGLVARDQMVGPYQLPVADCALSCSSFFGRRGRALALGERPVLALFDPEASVRMALGEALTNLAAVSLRQQPVDGNRWLSEVAISANWMAASGQSAELERLYRGVEALTTFCKKLEIAIPVGKDSLSMECGWRKGLERGAVVSPLSLVVTAACTVDDVGEQQTPCLQAEVDSQLMLVDLGGGQNRCGGSALAQVYGSLDGTAPDIDSETLAAFFAFVQHLHQRHMLLAYHDRSDGGLLVCLLEMLFAGRMGARVDFDELAGEVQLGPQELLCQLFNEELGAVIQVKRSDVPSCRRLAEAFGLRLASFATLTAYEQGLKLLCQQGNGEYAEYAHFDLETLQRRWSETSYRMAALRDHQESARQEWWGNAAGRNRLVCQPSFRIAQRRQAPSKQRPRAAILREQGVNGQLEMAAAFHRAGFDSVDVSINDLLAGRQQLHHFQLLALCGGFSFGDVLGAATGWAQGVLLHPELAQQFGDFFQRADTLTLGVCNGCQTLSQLATLIPQASHWPALGLNRSEQYESRVVMVRVEECRSPWLTGMAGSILPVPVAHRQGRVHWQGEGGASQLDRAGQVALRFCDAQGRKADSFPLNPSGSTDAVTGFCAADGRVLAMMPHPERLWRRWQGSWNEESWGEHGPWLRLFDNARCWFG